MEDRTESTNQRSLSEGTRLMGSAGPSTASIDRIRQRFPTVLKKRLENVAREQHVSLFAVLFGSWAMLLARWFAHEEVLVGARWTRRLQNGELRVDGADRPMPLRLAVDEHTPVKELLKRADSVLAEAIAHSNVPMNDVRSAIRRSDDEGPQLHALIAFDDAHARSSMELENESEACESPSFDLAFVVEEVDGIWTGSLDYRKDLFDRDTVSRIADSCNVLLHAIVKHARRPVGQLGLLSRAQRDRVIYENNATAADYPRDKLIHELFEAQASRVPDALALKFREETLTYAQLNQRANQLAHYLRRQGVARRDRVGICLERSIDTVIAILGALKTGAVYVPLDPGYPLERLAYLLENAAPIVVLTHAKLKTRLPQGQTPLITLDELSEQIAREDHRNPAHKDLTSEDLAYLIYTSGSTGQPKGVMVRHRNVVNYATYAVRQFDVERGDGSLIGTSLSVDLALTGFYPPLICGRAVTLCADEEELAQALLSGRSHAPVNLQGSANRWWGEQICWDMEGAVPIGKPIANTQIYVLNAYRSPMPVGVAGEIYIGGDGVAAGYWNRPELTAEHFLSDPFSSDPNACMYRTGDLGRWRPDGTIEYLGRNDSCDGPWRSGEFSEPLAQRSFEAPLSGAQAAKATAFFRSKLGDVEEPTAPFGLIDVRGDGSQIDQAQRAVEEALSRRARAAARELGVSAATLFHVAWALVVARCSGRDDVVFGSVVSGPLQSGHKAERSFEMFPNPLPLRLKLAGVSARQLVKRTYEELMELLDHAQVSLALVQRCSSVDSDTPLFSAILSYRHTALRAVNAVTSLVKVGKPRTHYPCSLFVDDLEEEFSITVQTQSGVDPHRVSSYVHTALESLVQALEDAPQRAALELAVLPPSERREVVEEFNATQAEYASEALIHELFEAQVRKTPQAIAVAYMDKQLSYEQLNARANQLADYLRERGVGPDQFVGICVERSLEMAVGLLGILKAGGAYVPLDPSYPVERLEYMLKDATPKVLLTLETLRRRLPETAADVIAMDADWQKIAERRATDVESRKTGLHSGNLAYVIYTSGSTGQPKGVLVEHGSVTNLWGSLERLYRQSAPCKHVALNASLNFDASVQQLVQLLSGRRLSIVPQEYRLNVHKLLNYIEDHQIDAIDCTPSQLKVWVDAGMLEKKYPHMVLVGGEAIDAELWRRLAQCDAKRFFNVYGPTECTVDATACRLDPDIEPTIGRPLDNTQVYILDARKELLPVGVTGELYIGGRGVARGYLNRAKLTEERFLRDPFSADADARMYRTGDLGRWRADGTIEHLGRNDDQVKIRGFRIELGEIGARLREHQLVREAVVIALEFTPGNTRLVAYITARGERRPDPKILRSHLSGTLPDYMIPAAFVVLERLPLTQSGKLDRRALPSPAAEDFAKREYTAPRGRIEEVVADLWRSLLNTDRIGRDDNFFELGGHSLLLVQLAARLQSLGLSADVFNIFRAPTLGGFAATLNDADASEAQTPANRIPLGCDSISPRMLSLIELEAEHIARIAVAVPGGASNIQDIYPLASLQEGILFHHLLHAGGADPYVFSSLLSVARLERLNDVIRAFQSVINRHDVLRTAILWEDLPNPIQVVCRNAPLPVEEIVLDQTREVREQVDEWLAAERQRMDIRQAPLIRMKVAADPWNEQWYVILQVHHIGIDYQSMATLLREAMSCLQGEEGMLAEPVPYRNHVARTRVLAQIDDAEAFFRDKLGDVDETTAPFGLLDTRGDASRVDAIHASVDRSLGERVRAQARRLGMSPATLFHAAWALVVAQTSGRDDVVFGTVLMGRMQASVSIDTALGMFINTLPMRVALRDLTVRQLVEVTQRELVELLRHEQVSLSLVQRCSAVNGSAPLFTALLNYVHNTLGFDVEDGHMGEGVQLLERRQWSNFPIVVSVEDKPEGFLVTAQTDRKVDPRRIATYLVTAMQSLVHALEFAPHSRALQLALLPEDERRRVIVEFNSTERAYPHEQRVHERFEEMARASPDAIAVSDELQDLTYAQLNARANQLARYFLNHGVKPGEYVVLLMERSLAQVLAQLAILKCGAAYVPLDPKQPIEQQTFMVADCGARRVIVEDLRAVQMACSELQWISYPIALEAAAALSTANLFSAEATEGPVCLMYTSGSTGTPNGVVVPQRAVLRLAVNNAYAGISAEDCIAYCSSCTFEASTFEVWGTLLNGARLVVVPQSVVLEPARFAEALQRTAMTVLFLTTDLFMRCADSLSQVFSRLRYLIIGGEWGDPEVVRGVLANCPPQHLLNAYGATECTGFSTMFEIATLDAGVSTLPIGRPIANAAIYILNCALEPVPIGAAGEIYVGGAGVALGYLNRPEMTSQQFMPDVFARIPGARLYKTGDLGRWREDGNVELLRRNDQRAKALARVPSTSNAKSDPRAQFAPHLEALVSWPHEPPVGEIEEAIAAIWCELLHLERIGRHEHFFELGGHSLLAMQVVVRIRSQLSLEIAISELFDNPVLDRFAARVALQREQVLLERLESGGAEIDALLEQVASMSEHEIDKLMVQLRAGGRL